MTDPTTPRPDPVTEARDEAVYRALLMLTGDTPRPAAPHEFVRLLEQDGYTVIALARATPPPAVDGTRCGWRYRDAYKHDVTCDAVREAPEHEHDHKCAPDHDPDQWCHPFTPPAPDTRLRALEAALVEIDTTIRASSTMTWKDRAKRAAAIAARALLADGEGVR